MAKDQAYLTIVGNRITALLDTKKWTHGDLARAMKVGESQVSNWTRGATGLSTKNARKMAPLLGVSLDTLLSKEPGIAAQREHAPPNTAVSRLVHKYEEKLTRRAGTGLARVTAQGMRDALEQLLKEEGLTADDTVERKARGTTGRAQA